MLAIKQGFELVIFDSAKQVTYTTLAVSVNPEAVADCLAVVARTMPEVSPDVLNDVFPVALGAGSTGNLEHLFAAQERSSRREDRLFLDTHLLVGLLRVRGGYSDAQLGVLATAAARVLHRGYKERFSCTTVNCPYAEEDDAYSQEPAYRMLLSDGRMMIPDHGMCLNCIDDSRRASEDDF